MSEIKSRADLFEAAAKMMRMCDEAGVDYVFKFDGVVYNTIPHFVNFVDKYEFPLAIVEGKPVFKGDKLYDSYGRLVNVEEAKKFDGDDAVSLRTDGRWYRLDSYSWNPPKPKTVMVEVEVVDAKLFIELFDKVSEGDHFANRIVRNFSKALEESK